MNQDLSASNISGVEKKLARTGPRRLLLRFGRDPGADYHRGLGRNRASLRKLLRPGDDFVLADYFDYIGGTSVGQRSSPPAWPSASPWNRTRAFFVKSAPAMFLKARWWQRLRYKYRCDRSAGNDQDGGRELPVTAPEKSDELRDALGTAKLRTLLMLVMRNATTDSPWPISNNPLAKYNRIFHDPGCNLKIPAVAIDPGSTAAPTFFPPEVVKLGSNTFVFDDGAMTPFGNPAFQLFLMATLGAHRLNWPTGEEKMLLVSVGTGSYNQARPEDQPRGREPLLLRLRGPSHHDRRQRDLPGPVCRVFGLCKVGDPIDTEVGDLIAEPRGPVAPKLFTYLRYDADLSDAGLEQTRDHGRSRRRYPEAGLVCPHRRTSGHRTGGGKEG